MTRKQGSKRHSAEQWAEIVEAWEQSGISAADFAAARDFSESSLRWWKRHFLQMRAGRGPVLGKHAAGELRLIPVDVIKEPGSASRSRDASAEAEERRSENWELRTPAGYALQVRGRLDAAHVQLLLRVLGDVR